jgi:hypothetical protein
MIAETVALIAIPILVGSLAVARHRRLGSFKRGQEWVPLDHQPLAVTWNGVGTMIYGSEYDEAGRDVTTLYFTILFIPTVPLVRYRVQREEKGRIIVFEEEGPAKVRDWVRVLHWWSWTSMAVTAVTYVTSRIF